MAAPPAPPPAPAAYGKPPTKVLGRRFVALIIDGILLAAIVVGLGLAFGNVHHHGSTYSYHVSGIKAVIPALAGFLYYWLAEGLAGATVGKAVTGIRVRTADGAVPGLGRSLIRNILRVIDGIFGYLVGWIVAMATGEQRRQRVGDLAAKTFVVRR